MATCSSSPPRARAIATIARRAACRIRRTTWPASASTTSPIRRSRAWSRTCRRARARTRTRSSRIRRTRTSSTSTCPAARRRDRTASWPDAGTARTRPTKTNSLFRLDVIKVTLEHPEKAAGRDGCAHLHGTRCRRRVRRAASAWPARSAEIRRRPPPPTPTGPRNCHDVTAYPAMNLLAGACASYGLLVDISNPEKPVRLDARTDTNFSLWHTAVFSNDGKKVVFTDEWGGGTSPMCQANSMMEMGGNTILTIGDGEEVHAARVLQDSDGADRAGELRVAQRRAHSGAGARHHGAGLVPGRRERDGLHRSGPSARDGVLRPRADRCAAGGRCAGHASRAADAVAATAARSAARGARTTGTE